MLNIGEGAARFIVAKTTASLLSFGGKENFTGTDLNIFFLMANFSSILELARTDHSYDTNYSYVLKKYFERGAIKEEHVSGVDGLQKTANWIAHRATLADGTFFQFVNNSLAWFILRRYEPDWEDHTIDHIIYRLNNALSALSIPKEFVTNCLTWLREFKKLYTVLKNDVGKLTFDPYSSIQKLVVATDAMVYDCAFVQRGIYFLCQSFNKWFSAGLIFQKIKQEKSHYTIPFQVYALVAQYHNLDDKLKFAYTEQMSAYLESSARELDYNALFDNNVVAHQRQFIGVETMSVSLSVINKQPTVLEQVVDIAFSIVKTDPETVVNYTDPSNFGFMLETARNIVSGRLAQSKATYTIAYEYMTVYQRMRAAKTIPSLVSIATQFGLTSKSCDVLIDDWDLTTERNEHGTEIIKTVYLAKCAFSLFSTCCTTWLYYQDYKEQWTAELDARNEDFVKEAWNILTIMAIQPPKAVLQNLVDRVNKSLSSGDYIENITRVWVEGVLLSRADRMWDVDLAPTTELLDVQRFSSSMSEEDAVIILLNQPTSVIEGAVSVLYAHYYDLLSYFIAVRVVRALTEIINFQTTVNLINGLHSLSYYLKHTNLTKALNIINYRVDMLTKKNVLLSDFGIWKQSIDEVIIFISDAAREINNTRPFVQLYQFLPDYDIMCYRFFVVKAATILCKECFKTIKKTHASLLDTCTTYGNPVNAAAVFSVLSFTASKNAPLKRISVSYKNTEIELPYSLFLSGMTAYENKILVFIQRLQTHLIPLQEVTATIKELTSQIEQFAQEDVHTLILQIQEIETTCVTIMSYILSLQHSAEVIYNTIRQFLSAVVPVIHSDAKTLVYDIISTTAPHTSWLSQANNLIAQISHVLKDTSPCTNLHIDLSEDEVKLMLDSLFHKYKYNPNEATNMPEFQFTGSYNVPLSQCNYTMLDSYVGDFSQPTNNISTAIFKTADPLIHELDKIKKSADNALLAPMTIG